MENFLTFLITPLLSAPEALSIVRDASGYSVTTSPSDTGMIIGKNGSVINSIRSLAKSYCLQHRLPPANIRLATQPLKTDQN